MRYKTLILGGNQSMIDDIFNHLGNVFVPVTSSLRHEDILSHIKYFNPDLILFAASHETRDIIARLAKLRDFLTTNNIAFILVGSEAVCQEVMDVPEASQYVDFIVEKPSSIQAVSNQIVNYMEERAYQREAQLKQNAAYQKAEAERLAKEAELNRRKHILVVDDDPVMLKTIKECLKENYDVATAVSGRIALKFLESKKTDLILLDYEMPVEDGPFILNKIRSNDEIKDLPVIFLTGITDREKIKKVLLMKPQGYLLKPIDGDKLMEILDSTFYKLVYGETATEDK